MYCLPHISLSASGPLAFCRGEVQNSSTLNRSSLLNRVKPLLSIPVFHKWDNGATHPTAHCPDILNLWEGEHPYSPAYVSVATQKVYQSPEASFCFF